MTLVSAVIPAYNAENYIEAAIESVLAQSAQPIECIVADDGSTDGTAGRVIRFGDKVRLLRKPNGGVSSARNAGAHAARGDYIAFLDADDVWLPEKTARQLELFRVRPDVALVYSAAIIGNETLRPTGMMEAVAGDIALVNAITMTPPHVPLTMTGMIRREAFHAVGGFDEQLSTSADLDFVVRVAQRYRLAAIAEPLAIYRRHGAQMHLNLERMERDMLRLFDKLPDELRPLAARGTTKLYYSLALSHVRRGDVRETARCAAAALRRPDLIARFLWEGARRRFAAAARETAS